MEAQVPLGKRDLPTGSAIPARVVHFACSACNTSTPECNSSAVEEPPLTQAADLGKTLRKENALLDLPDFWCKLISLVDRVQGDSV